MKCSPSHPRAIEFAIAYRRYLDRNERSEREHNEPNAAHYNIDEELAKGLRKAVWQDRARDVMMKVRGWKK